MWNKQFYAYVNQAWIRSWNQPVLSNESKFLAQGNNVGLWWCSNSRLTGYELDVLQTAPCCPTYISLIINEHVSSTKRTREDYLEVNFRYNHKTPDIKIHRFFISSWSKDSWLMFIKTASNSDIKAILYKDHWILRPVCY